MDASAVAHDVTHLPCAGSHTSPGTNTIGGRDQQLLVSLPKDTGKVG